jgi:rubrerythrin
MMMLVNDAVTEVIDSNSKRNEDEEKQLCPNCGFAILEYDENSEFSCPVCNYGKTRYHT